MANLAIKGHPTRGNEVIEILEMLGGTNGENYWGVFDNRFYLINALGDIDDRSLIDKSNYQLYTLEEFLEKFPYKVGDKVSIPEYESEVRIDDMKWNGVEILYSVFTDEVEWYSADELNDFNNVFITMEEKKINQMSLTNCDLDEVEIVLGDKFELVNREGKYYAVRKKPKYPKTYEECCDVLKIPNDERYIDIDVPLDYNKLLYAFTELLICRDAYWKIAGEQMGLGKPWEPDWLNTEQDKFVIYTHNNVIHLNCFLLGHNVLAFPTFEIRAMFYKNFKELIESCKELL